MHARYLLDRRWNIAGVHVYFIWNTQDIGSIARPQAFKNPEASSHLNLALWCFLMLPCLKSLLSIAWIRSFYRWKYTVWIQCKKFHVSNSGWIAPVIHRGKKKMSYKLNTKKCLFPSFFFEFGQIQVHAKLQLGY